MRERPFTFWREGKGVIGGLGLRFFGSFFPMPPKRKAKPEQEVEGTPAHKRGVRERRAPVRYTGGEQVEVLAAPPRNRLQDPVLGASSPPKKARKVGRSDTPKLLSFSDDQRPDEPGSAVSEETESESSGDDDDPVNEAFVTVEEQDNLLKALDDATEKDQQFYYHLFVVADAVRKEIPGAVPSFFAACESVLEALPQSSESQSLPLLLARLSEFKQVPGAEALFNSIMRLSKIDKSGPLFAAQSLLKYLEIVAVEEQDNLLKALDDASEKDPFYDYLFVVADTVRWEVPGAVPSFFAACESVLEALPQLPESQLPLLLEGLSEFKQVTGATALFNSIVRLSKAPRTSKRLAAIFTAQSLLKYLEIDAATKSQALERDKLHYREGMTSLSTVNGFTPPPLDSEAVAASPETLESSFILHLDSDICSWCPNPQFWKAHQETEKERMKDVWDNPLEAMINSKGTLFHSLNSIEKPNKTNVAAVMRQFETEKGLWSSTLTREPPRTRNQEQEPQSLIPSLFDESVLYQAVLRLFEFDMQNPNPLVDTNLLSEGFFHDLISTTWITSSLLDPNLATGQGSFQVMVGEKSSKSPKNRRMLQQAPGRERQGHKVDIFAQVPVFDNKMSELFFVEEKPITSTKKEADDFLKLSKVMLDGFGCVTHTWFPNCTPHPDAVVFGMQIVGLQVTILRVDATYQEVTNLHTLSKSTVFSRYPSRSVKALVKAVASMALIKRQLRKYADAITQAAQESRETPIFNSPAKAKRAVSTPTPNQRSRQTGSGGSRMGEGTQGTKGGNSDADLDSLPITDLRDLPAGTLVNRFTIGRMIEKGDSSPCWIATGQDTLSGQDVIVPTET